MTGGKRVVVLAAAAFLLLLLYIVSSINMNGGGTRTERALFPGLAPERTESLQIRFSGGGIDNAYRFVGRNDRWMIERGGVLRPADKEHVGEAVRQLAELMTGGSVAEKEHARERLKLTSAAADVIEVAYRKQGEKETTRVKVLVGALVPGTSRRYVRRAGEAQIVSVKEPELLQHIHLSYWADLRLFPSHPDPSDVIRLHLQSFRGDELELIRRESPEGAWHVQGEGPEAKLPAQGSERVLQFVRSLFSLRGESFAASCDVEETPLIRITAEDGRGRTFRLEVYPRRGNGGYIVCSNRGDERAPIPFVVREQDFSLLSSGLERILSSADQ